MEHTVHTGDLELQEVLERGFEALERTQPELSTWLGDMTADRNGSITIEEPQKDPGEFLSSLGYFLSVTVFMVFREAFGKRVRKIEARELELAAISFATDVELRKADPLEALTTRDWLRLAQPSLVRFVEEHVHDAKTQAPEGVKEDDFTNLVHCVFIEILALSYAIEAPVEKASRPLLLS